LKSFEEKREKIRSMGHASDLRLKEKTRRDRRKKG